MFRRWSLAGQLLALQLAIVAVVLVGVGAVSLAQAGARFREVEGQEALAAAENLAATATVRSQLQARDRPDPRVLAAAAAGAGDFSGASYVRIVAPDQRVLADSEDPGRVGSLLELSGSSALAGRSWVGTDSARPVPAVSAHVPVQAEDDGRVVGLVAVGRTVPTLGQRLRDAAPNLLTYLGLASLFGLGGSLLVARRVKRQTLGLEPREIRGLAEYREALLTGIKEGVLALDAHGRITLVNAEGHQMLRLPTDCIGRDVAELGLDARLLDVLAGRVEGRDSIVLVGERVLTLNRRPVAVRGVSTGSVTTMRDLTELTLLQRELGVTRQATDALRAQAHEFANRLHTISGLLELGEHDEVLRYVKRLGGATERLSADVTGRLADPALAALLIAKASQAAERGVRLRLTPGSELGPLDEQLSEDLATVVGNLVDNAVDAVGLGGGEVEVEVVDEPDAVRVVVRDTGPGVAPELVEEVFEHGFTTKAAADGSRGIGLALTRSICVRRGGRVDVRNEDGPREGGRTEGGRREGGAVFVACLPVTRGRVPS